MNKIKNFIWTSLLGGLTVVLPVAILVAILLWMFRFITNVIQPLTNVIVASSDLNEIVADVIAFVILAAMCFFIGLFVRTKLGGFLYSIIEKRVLKIAPGYKFIKETIFQVLGSKRAPFLGVALAKVSEKDVLVTAFITEEHASGWVTIFVPIGPTPTSGLIYHLPSENVSRINISIEDAMRTIISCGAGSGRLFEEYQKLKQ